MAHVSYFDWWDVPGYHLGDALMELLKLYPCALPDHLKNRLHNDWPPLLNKIPRSWNARGPRCKGASCECGGAGFMSWPPKLVKGHDIVRWEWSDLSGKHRSILIEAFIGKTIDANVYDREWKAVDVANGQIFSVDLLKGEWWPSIIPTGSLKGWIELSPWFKASWDFRSRMFRRYFRIGNRPDFEQYYNIYAPYAGRNPE